jgi:histidyl-tRNA synthetase
LTVPFSRLVAQYPEQLVLPFRRYHVGPVFRDDKPGPGRFRQFTQFDLDAAGSDSVAVDAEIIAAVCDVMKSLGFDGADHAFRIMVNNRKLFDALSEACGPSAKEKERHILRVVDKLAKVGIENIRKELGEGRIDESGDPIRGVGLSADVIDKIVAFISISGTSRGEVIESLSKQLPTSDAAKEGLREMSDLAACLDQLDVSENAVRFDPSLARGLDYYTGPVFEGIFPSAPEFGSFMGGGRYNQLAERFRAFPIPATGASIGLDRFIAALSKLGKVEKKIATQVIILALPGTPTHPLLRLATELRAAQIATEIYLGAPQEGLRNQLAFANQRQIPVAVIVGENELSTGTVTVKDLKAGLASREGIQDRESFRKAGKTGQTTLPRDQMIATIRRILVAYF